MGNIFFGDSKYAKCVREWDRLLRTQEWVSTEVFAEIFNFAEISGKDFLAFEKQIKAAKKDISRALAERGMSLQEKMDSQDGRRRLTAYPSYNKDPLHDLRILAKVEDAMMNKHALRVTYTQSYHQEKEHIFHAHYRKVYNGRHYVYGIFENEEENQCLPFVTLAVDRIVEACTTKEVSYRPGDLNYEDLMKDVLGASPNFKYPKVEKVVLCTHDPKVHKLLLNKPLHDSIREQQPCTEEQKGLLTLHVQLTQELRNCILYYGQGVEVVSPPILRRQISNGLLKMVTYYTEQ